MNILLLLLGFAFYAYISYSLQTIFRKLNLESPWLAWIPIANLCMIYIAGGQQWWWIIIALIPIINIAAFIMSIIAWVNITKKLGKSPWLLLLF